MYEPHQDVIFPSDSDSAIWRYLDTPKLVAMLHSQSLWFARVDTLEDVHEGAGSPAAEAQRARAMSAAFLLEDDEKDDRVEEIARNQMSRMREIRRAMRRHTYVNCWHQSSYESMAMWRLYGSAGQAVAIKSTAGRLRDAMQTEHTTWLGEVQYIDYAEVPFPGFGWLAPYFFKRSAFAFEHELRGVIIREPATLISEPSPLGLYVRVDLPVLIDEIVVTPGQPAWFRETIEQVVDAFAPGFPVRHSDLDVDAN